MKWIYAPLLVFQPTESGRVAVGSSKIIIPGKTRVSIPQKVVASKLFNNQAGVDLGLISQPDVSASCLEA